MRSPRAVKGLWVAMAVCGAACDSTAPSPPRWATLAVGADALVWATDDSGSFSFANPLVSGGRVFYPGGRGSSPMLFVRDAITGARIWSSPTSHARHIAASGNNVAVVGEYLEVFTPSGVDLFELTSPRGYGSNLVVDGTRLILGTVGSGAVQAVDAVQGTTQWRTQVGGDTMRLTVKGVSLAGDRVFASIAYLRPGGLTADTGIVAAMDRATGSLLWRRVVDLTWVWTPPLPVGDKIYVATTRAHVVALSQATGDEIWRWQPSAPLGASNLGTLAYCDGRVFAPDGDRVIALSPDNGSVMWTSPPLFAGTFLSGQCSEGRFMGVGFHLRILDAATGSVVGAFPLAPPRGEADALQDFLFLGATRSNGMIYATTNFGFLKFKAP